MVTKYYGITIEVLRLGNTRGFLKNHTEMPAREARRGGIWSLDAISAPNPYKTCRLWSKIHHFDHLEASIR